MSRFWKIVLALLVVLVAVGAGYYLNWERKVSHGLPIPGAPVSFPLGNVAVLFTTTNFLVGLETLAKQFADQVTGLASIWQFDTQFVAVTHHQDIEAIMSVTTDRVSASRVQTLMEYVLGKTALISLNGEEWAKYRKVIYAAVSAADFAKMVPDIIRQVDATATFFSESGRQLDAAPYVRNMAFKIIGTNVYNRPLTGVNNGTEAAVTLMLTELVRRTSGANPLDVMFWVPTEENKALSHSRDLFHNDIKAELKNRQGRFEDVDIHHEDFLKHLLAGKNLSDDEIVDAVSSMVFGSTETYSAFFATALYVVGANKDVQAKIYDEVKVAFANYPASFDIKSLPYTHLVVQELLRLYPPAPLTQRTLTKDIKVGKGSSTVTIPKGYGIWIPPWVSQRLEANFVDALKFNPDRFLDKVPPYASIPFSAGPRNCVAAAFAEKLLTVVVARFVFNADFDTVATKEPTQFSNGFTEWPENGVPVIFKARN